MKRYNLLLIILLFFCNRYFLQSQDLSPEDIYEKVNNTVVVIIAYDFNGHISKQGSGVVINEKGFIVTNYHVFAECEKIEIIHNNQSVKYTDIIGVDIEKDILILKIDDNTFPTIKLGDYSNLKIGQKVYAIGSPLGLENSLSDGLIGGFRYIGTNNVKYIQISASISPGSSGGAVVNSKGELIGISTLSFVEGQNLNFAIPVSEVLNIDLSSYNDKNVLEAFNYYYMGYNAINSKNYSRAIGYFNLAIHLNPDKAKFYTARGIAYFELKDYKNALINFNKALEYDSSDINALFVRGKTYVFLGQFEEALSDFDRSIIIQPTNPFAYRNRGLFYGILGKKYLAIDDLEMTIILDPAQESELRPVINDFKTK